MFDDVTHINWKDGTLSGDDTIVEKPDRNCVSEGKGKRGKGKGKELETLHGFKPLDLSMGSPFPPFPFPNSDLRASRFDSDLNRTELISCYSCFWHFLLVIFCFELSIGTLQVSAQSITPSADGTGTVVTSQGNQLDISGGSLSKDGANLFHSFTKFDLDQNQIATFLSRPSIQNILGRVTGGDASIINGLIQVTGGSSNLFLMNPSGILFGANARLNVPADFTATTATGIGFGSNGLPIYWFNATGANNYADLVGTPNAFAFSINQPGAVVNAGQLAVTEQRNLTLLGGTTISTGKLTAPRGQLTVAAVPGQNLLRLSLPGHLLSLEIQPMATAGSQPQGWNLLIASLPELLTGNSGGSATGLTVNSEGKVVLTGGMTLPESSVGTAIATGTLDVSGQVGGAVQVLGETVGLVGAQIKADGTDGGGTVLIGGDYQGQGSVPTALRTYVSSDSKIDAGSILNGDGGRVIVWADGATGFYGNISARGGSSSSTGGNGGFVEVSGKQSLIFKGTVDTLAPYGNAGTLLLDPANIAIANGIDDGDDNGISDNSFGNDALGSNGQTLATDPLPTILYESELENLSGNTNITLQAANSITINPLTTDGTLTFTPGTGSIEFSSGGTFSMDPGNTIQTSGRDLTISATGDITTGTLNSQALSSGNGGNLTLISNAGAINTTGGNLVTQSAVGNGGRITLAANGNITTNSLFSLSSSGNGGDINLTSTAGAIATRGGLNSAASVGNGGAIALNAPNSITTATINSTGAVVSGDIRLTSNEIDFTGGPNSVRGTGTPLLQPFSNNQNIEIGGGSDGTNALDLTATDLAALQAGFSTITIGRTDSTGTLTIVNPIAFNQPVTLTAADIAVNGAIAGTGNAAVTLNGATTLNTDVSTQDQNITINGNTVLGNNITLDTGVTGGGNIVVNGSIDGSNNLTLGAGTGDINLNGNLGSGTRLGNLTINSANSTAIGAIAATSISQNAVTGTSTYGTLDAAGNINLSGNNFNFNGAIATTNGGGLTINHTGSLTLNAATNLDGTFLQTGSGDVTIGGNITTTNDDIRFSGPVRLNGNVELNLGTGTLTFGSTLAAGNNALTLTADEIDLTGSVTGGSTLVLQPFRPSQDIEIAGGGNTMALDLTTAEIAALQDGFSAITIGRTDSTGAIAIVNPITFSDPVLIQAPSSSITANGAITGLDNASINLVANQNITTSNVTANSGIALTSQTGTVTTGDLNSSSATGGGNITVRARDRITTGIINSSSSSGNGGSVTLDPENDIQVTSINTQGGTSGSGGNIDITTQGFFQATGTFTDLNGINASLSTAGGAGGGAITIQHGGNGVTPFVVGDATTNGTAGAITTRAENTISPTQSFLGEYFKDNIGIITQNPPLPQPEPLPSPSQPEPIPSPSQPEPIPSPSQPEPLPSPSQPEPLPSSPQPEPLPLPSPPQAEAVPLSPPQRTELPSVSIDTFATDLEQLFTRQYETYLRLQGTSLKTLSDIRNTVRSVEETTGVKPAVIYAVFVPSTLASTSQLPENRLPQESDELELIMVSKESVIRKRVSGATRSQVLKVAAQFRTEVSKITSRRSHLIPALTMYQWLVAPLEADLQTQRIQNLVFIMDAGLRTIPLAALHDGQGFLVEKYSVGLMPSLSLTDTRYGDIKNSQVLAMGVSQFTDQNPLPAVPIELSVITHDLWQGKSFLNAALTLDNLKSQRRQQPFGIIHLATHAVFEPSEPGDSYIQLWDTRLRLDQLRQLGWNDPPVQLLVLSACKTAQGDEDVELGFAGLAVQAGVKSALASLWYVSDEGSLGLMTNFYEQLRQAPIKAEALRRAQVAMLKGEVRLENGVLHTPGESVPLPPELARLGNQNLSHPKFWSAFALIGNPW